MPPFEVAMVGKRVIHLDDMGSDSTASDPLVIFDRSENKTKRIDRSKLAEAIVADLPYNPTPGWSATTVPTAITEVQQQVGKNVNEFMSITSMGCVGDDDTINDTGFTLCEQSSTHTVFFVPEGVFRTNLFSLNKTYLGFGSIRFGDGVVQDCRLNTKQRARQVTGPFRIESATDIVLDPTGTVNVTNKRVTGVAVAVGQDDVLTPRAMLSGVCRGIRLSNAVGSNDNTITWFEQGTFQPTVRGVNVAGTATYTTQYGVYQRINNFVHVKGIVDFELVGASGAVIVDNLPVEAKRIILPSGVFAGGRGCGSVTGQPFTGQFFFYALNFSLYFAQVQSDGSPNNTTDPIAKWEFDITYEVA